MTAARSASGRRASAARSAFAARRAFAFAARRASAGRRARGNRLLAVSALSVAAWLVLASRVYVNASWSDDAWGYVLLPIGTLQRGDVVIFDAPDALGANAPYLKSVRGVPGDRIAVDDRRRVWVNGEIVGRAKPLALNGRALEPVSSGLVAQDRYFVFADHLDSHDSRYAEVGLVPRERIRGRAVALPDIPWLGLEGPLVQPGPAGQGPAGQEVPR